MCSKLPVAKSFISNYQRNFTPSKNNEVKTIELKAQPIVLNSTVPNNEGKTTELKVEPIVPNNEGKTTELKIQFKKIFHDIDDKNDLFKYIINEDIGDNYICYNQISEYGHYIKICEKTGEEIYNLFMSDEIDDIECEYITTFWNNKTKKDYQKKYVQIEQNIILMVNIILQILVMK
jgi:hypothetical protein